MTNQKLAIGSISANIYTSPHSMPELDPETAILAALKKAKQVIYFSAFTFTLSSVADLLVNAHKNGVQIIAVCDDGSETQVNSQVPKLVAAGIAVHTWGSTWRLMHEKAFVIDHKVAGLGSYNFTTQAEKENTEVFLIAQGTQVSRIMAPIMEQQIQAAYNAGKALS